MGALPRAGAGWCGHATTAAPGPSPMPSHACWRYAQFPIRRRGWGGGVGPATLKGTGCVSAGSNVQRLLYEPPALRHVRTRLFALGTRAFPGHLWGWPKGKTVFPRVHSSPLPRCRLPPTPPGCTWLSATPRFVVVRVQSLPHPPHVSSGSSGLCLARPSG